MQELLRIKVTVLFIIEDLQAGRKDLKEGTLGVARDSSSLVLSQISL